jgi:Ca2+-transporting ATPase
MPVHILFLQLVIDPACSVVFEAEPLEAKAMTERPRMPSTRLFDAAVLARGFWQGIGLLGILLVVYVLTRSVSGSENVSRAMVFMVLVLSNLGLIQVNRSWAPTSLRGPRVANQAFVWISLLTLVLLTAVLTIPVITQLFAFEVPSPELLLGGLAATLVGLVWFEAVKWAFARQSLGRA